jgi:hypothetical protein
MIDLTRIRSVKTLEEMKRDLEEFMVNSAILTTYVEELDWSEDDLIADRETVSYLLEKLDRRIKSLTRLEEKEDSQRTQKSEPEVSSSAQ